MVSKYEVFRHELTICLGMDQEDLKSKAKELWDQIVKLETERYDLEERARRQDYDVSCGSDYNNGIGRVFL